MKSTTVLLACVFLSTMAFAKEPRFYQNGRIMNMESSPCGYAEKSGKTVLGEIVGTDGGHKNTKEMLCPEYTLRSDKVLYRIRPRDEKHPVLLPVGEDAQFRIHRDKLILKIDELGGKERDYTVVSMTPVDSSSTGK